MVDARFDSDRDDVIRNALEAGVDRVLTVGIDLRSSRASLELAATHPMIEAAVGIHPAEAESFGREGGLIYELVQGSKPRAVGEIGLDYGRCPVSRDQQLHAFRAQVKWAVDADLPVVVHNRDAHDDVLAVLSELRARGVLHCFSGDRKVADNAIAIGLFISFAGNLTYKNATELHGVAQSIPSDRLLVETDSPYLPPQGWRGQRNEPAHVAAVAGRLGELRGISLAEVATATSANAAAVFGWEKAEG